MKWTVIDSLYNDEAFWCGHLDSYSHYLREAGEDVATFSLAQGGLYPWRVQHTTASEVIFALDGYEFCSHLPADLHVAQVAAICSPMPWEVRKPDGSPAYDLVLSSLHWMVDAARAAGCRAEYMPLAFDTRARVAGMGIKRERKAIFVGTRGSNHRKREEWLTALSDIVEVRPPCFGRAYFRELASAAVVLHVHAEWSRGEANAMRILEAEGMAATCVSDGTWEHGEMLPGWYVSSPPEARRAIMCARDDDRAPGYTLAEHTYESRIPRLIEIVRAL